MFQRTILELLWRPLTLFGIPGVWFSTIFFVASRTFFYGYLGNFIDIHLNSNKWGLVILGVRLPLIDAITALYTRDYRLESVSLHNLLKYWKYMKYWNNPNITIEILLYCSHMMEMSILFSSALWKSRSWLPLSIQVQLQENSVTFFPE